jgi:hypothetical protein
MIAQTQQNCEHSVYPQFTSVNLYVRVVGSSSSLRYGCVFLGLAGTLYCPRLGVHSGGGGLAVSSEAVPTESEFMYIYLQMQLG